MWTQRADYLYILPAFIVLMIVIAYPVYYTIELSFFQTPSSLQLRDKVFNGKTHQVFGKQHISKVENAKLNVVHSTSIEDGMYEPEVDYTKMEL